MNPIAGNAAIAAAQIVEQRGDAAERARLRYMLAGEPASAEAVRQALAGQRADGGWQAAWAPDYSSLDATCQRLARAEQLGLGTGEPAVMRALLCLAQRQQGDGAWEEDPEVDSMAPAWDKPGNREARLYLTANCGYWLARAARPGAGSLRESAVRASGYLDTYLDSRGRLPSFLPTHWLAAGLWHCLDHRGLADNVYAFLEGRVPEMPASSLAWLIIALRGVGLEAGHSLVLSGAMRLAGLQAGDGRWPSEDGPGGDVSATLDALYALKRAEKI
jgi:hypothetical protein